MALLDQVCNGCWKRGVCEDNRCRCRCTKDNWAHTDDPRNFLHLLDKPVNDRVERMR